MDIYKKVKKIIQELKLFKKGKKVIVAVSGGPDSVCFLDILYRLKDEIEIKLIIAHFNHGLRDRESDEDERFVKKLAYNYSLPFYSQKARRFPKSNVEEWAREARYQFLIETAQKNQTSLIAVAHTADDQIETVLMNALRGAGLTGLCGMEYKSEFFKQKEKYLIIRPLLDIWRQEIEKYLIENNLTFRIDKSNFDLRFSRNKIRHKLIPALLKENPFFKKNFLTKIKKHQKEYKKFLEKIKTIFQKIIIKENEKMLKIDYQKFLSLPSLEQGEIIRLAIKKFRKHTLGFEKIHFKEIEELVKKRILGKKKIFKNLVFENQKDGFTIYKKIS